MGIALHAIPQKATVEPTNPTVEPTNPTRKFTCVFETRTMHFVHNTDYYLLGTITFSESMGRSKKTIRGTLKLGGVLYDLGDVNVSKAEPHKTYVLPPPSNGERRHGTTKSWNDLSESGRRARAKAYHESVHGPLPAPERLHSCICGVDYVRLCALTKHQVKCNDWKLHVSSSVATPSNPTTAAAARAARTAGTIAGGIEATDNGSLALSAGYGRNGRNGTKPLRAGAPFLAFLSPEAGDAGLGAIGDGGGSGGGIVDAADDSPEYQMNALGLIYRGRLVNTGAEPYTLTLADGKSKIEVQWLLDYRKFVLLPDTEAGRDKPLELQLACRDSPPPPLWYLLHEDSGIIAKLPDGVVKQTIELPSIAPRAGTPAADTSAFATAPSTLKDSHRTEDRSIRRRGTSRNSGRSIGTGLPKDDRNYASDENDGRFNAGPAPVHFTFSPETLSTNQSKSSRSPGVGVGAGLRKDDRNYPSDDDSETSITSPARSSHNFSFTQYGSECSLGSNGTVPFKSPGSPRQMVRGDGRPSFQSPKRRSRAHSHDTPNLISGAHTPKVWGHRREAPLTVSRSDVSRDPCSKHISAEIFLQCMMQQGQKQDDTNGILQRGILAAIGQGNKAIGLAASAQADATKALQQNAETKERLDEFGKRINVQDRRLDQHQYHLGDAADRLCHVEGKAAKVETLEEKIVANRDYADGRINCLGQRVDGAEKMAFAAYQKNAK